jgi:hypothetical protein
MATHRASDIDAALEGLGELARRGQLRRSAA